MYDIAHIIIYILKYLKIYIVLNLNKKNYVIKIKKTLITMYLNKVLQIRISNMIKLHIL